MTWLYILLGVAVLITVILCLPVTLCFSYQYGGEPSLALRYAFLRFHLYPQTEKQLAAAEKKKNKKETGKRAKEKQNKPNKVSITAMIDEMGVGETVQRLLSVLKTLPEAVRKALKGARIRRFRLQLFAAGDDAADTALKYGEICAAVWPALGFLSSFFTFIRPQIEMKADYMADETKISVSGTLSVTSARLVYAALWEIFQLIPLFRHRAGKKPDQTKSAGFENL